MSAYNFKPDAMPVYEQSTSKVTGPLPEVMPVPVRRMPVPVMPAVRSDVVAPATKCAFGMVPLEKSIPMKHHLFTGSS